MSIAKKFRESYFFGGRQSAKSLLEESEKTYVSEASARRKRRQDYWQIDKIKDRMVKEEGKISENVFIQLKNQISKFTDVEDKGKLQEMADEFIDTFKIEQDEDYFKVPVKMIRRFFTGK